ncbi:MULTISPECIES: class I SAM-dependent methyltransferase [Aphanothece]|uniref:class I SAM-dependent methyltransferase n=1 Tax=Aphanothece TaxID=1121 RepID=UPI00398513AF
MSGTGEAIRFSDGAAYDRFMGVWSRQVGREVLDWLAPAPDLRWLDVGCGNGAFTQLVAERWAPRSLEGVDPSEAQLGFARRHPALQGARFQLGNAMDLPYGSGSFDVAVMPLVIFFVPDPARGVAEMARVVVPGGTVAAYAWDMANGGFPYQEVRTVLEALGRALPMPPSPEASRLETLVELWANGGLEGIETRQVAVQRTFTGFEELWNLLLEGPSSGQVLATLTAAERMAVQERLRSRWQVQGEEPLTLSGLAHAIQGTVPGRP